MGFLDRLFGTDNSRAQAPQVPQNPYGTATGAGAGAPSTQPPRSEDEMAIERYRYLLRTAPPETIEQVHAEAFAKLTEPQRQQVLADISAGLPDAERPRTSNPNDMARAATRAEYTNPGFMERTLGNRGGYGQGPGFGSMVGGSILGTVAGYVIGSALVSTFMAPAFAGDPGSGDGSTDASGDGGDGGGGGEGGDAGGGAGDAGYGDVGAADAGGFAGGDFGGGDFGGGDFGGGDFGGF